jgi:hypothetical protein
MDGNRRRAVMIVSDSATMVGRCRTAQEER